MTEVVAALIWQGDRFLACQRPAHKARGLLWEFVGGKVEKDETRQEALVRECREELGVEVEVGSVMMDVLHEYPDLTVHLTLFHARIVSGALQKLEHNDFRFITVDEIPQYEFCPADVEILRELQEHPAPGFVPPVLQIKRGRPENFEERDEKEKRCYALLDSLHLPYWRVDHEAVFTMAMCDEIDRTVDAAVCKNLFLTNKEGSAYYLLMLCGDKNLKSKELARQIGEKQLVFAPPEKLLEYLNLTPGAVSFFGLLFDTQTRVQLLVDEDLLTCAYLGCHPCVNTATLRLRTADVFGPLCAALGHEARPVRIPASKPANSALEEDTL